MRNKPCFFRAMSSFFSNNSPSSKKMAPMKAKSKRNSNSKNNKAVEMYWRRKLQRLPVTHKTSSAVEVVDLTNDEIPPIRFQIVDEHQNEIPVLIQVTHSSSTERNIFTRCDSNVSLDQNMSVEQADLLNKGEASSQIQSVSDEQLGDTVTQTLNCDNEICDLDRNTDEKLHDVKDITSNRIDSEQSAKLNVQKVSLQTAKETVTKQKRKKPNQLVISRMFTVNDGGLFCCDICSEKFSSKNSVQLHLLKHKSGSKNKCNICGKWFSCKKYLERHLKRHFLSTNLMRKMDEAFDGDTTNAEKNVASENVRSSFIKLINDTSKEIVNLACGYCDQCFSTQEALVDHCRSHMTDLPFMCNICGTLFKQKAALVYHSRIHFKMIRRVKRKINNPFVRYVLQVYTCRDCDRSYVSWGTLNQHRITAHGAPFINKSGSLKKKSKNSAVEINPPVLNNQSCSTRSENANELEPLVIDKSLNSVNEKLSCHKCTELFSTKISLDEHIKNKHNISHECCHCFKTYQRKSSYEKHMQMHNKTRILACSLCEKSFSELQGLMEHVMTHSRSLYSCTCGKSFKYKEAFFRCYVSHIETKRFVCEECGHVAHSDADDRRHNFGCTKCKKFPPKVKQRFSCTDCSKTFTKEKMLEKHLSQHFRAESQPNQ